MIQAGSGTLLAPRRRRGIAVTSSVVPAFTPASLPNLSAWWDFSGLGLADNAAIASVTDGSGNSRTLAQATGTKQPLFKTAIQNGRGIGRFDGVDDFMIYDAGSTFFSGTTLTFALVYAIRSSATGCRSFAGADNATGDFDNSNGFRVLEGTATETDLTRNSGTRAAQTPRQANSTFALYMGWWDGVNANLRFNRAAASTASGASAGSFSMQRLYVAAGQFNGAVDVPGPYDVGEVVVCTTDIGGSNRTSLENYLQAKWGTP